MTEQSPTTACECPIGYETECVFPEWSCPRKGGIGYDEAWRRWTISMSDKTTGGYTRKEVVQMSAGLIAVSLRQFVHDAEQQLSGREIERLIQAAQLLETLNER